MCKRYVAWDITLYFMLVWFSLKCYDFYLRLPNLPRERKMKETQNFLHKSIKNQFNSPANNVAKATYKRCGFLTPSFAVVLPRRQSNLKPGLTRLRALPCCWEADYRWVRRKSRGWGSRICAWAVRCLWNVSGTDDRRWNGHSSVCGQTMKSCAPDAWARHGWLCRWVP